jgi:hypothetical protein
MDFCAGRSRWWLALHAGQDGALPSHWAKLAPRFTVLAGVHEKARGKMRGKMQRGLSRVPATLKLLKRPPSW